MRRLLLFVALVLLAAVVGCEPSIGPTFRTTFPENPGRDEGTVDLTGLPVILYDFTHLVTAVAVVEPPVYSGYRFGRVVQVDGDPSAIRIDWLAGACEGRVTILFLDAGDRYRLAMQASWKFGTLGCPAIGIPRSMIVRFKQPVAPSEITLKSPLDD